MSIQIIAIRYGSLPKTEKTISEYRFREEASGQVGTADKASLIEWLEKGNSAYVGEGFYRVKVQIVRDYPKYLRTAPDRFGVNNITSLPEF